MVKALVGITRFHKNEEIHNTLIQAKIQGNDKYVELIKDKFYERLLFMIEGNRTLRSTKFKS